MSAHLDLLMFAAACLVLLMGFPVAFTLAGVALAFGLIGQSLDIFDMGFFYALPQRIFGTMTNEVLIAVPLFVFMGTMLERARVAEDLLENMSRLFAGVRGGLGISVSIVGALLAASTGIVGATVVTMSLLSLPTMLRRGYAPSLAAGSIAAAGTLGQIIPPSIVLVLLGDVIANAYQKAQLEQGIFAPETVSVGELFSGSLIPGLVLVGLYIIYQVGLAFFRPSMAPPAEYDDDLVLSDLLGALFAPVFLIISVLGSILAGIATPTEAAAVGAVGTILLAGHKLGDRQKLMAAGALSVILVVVLASTFDLRLERDNIALTDLLAIGVALALCAVIALAVGTGLLAAYRL
ncbi:MAG: TRAP transporter large permease subunit, partial [Pseudomonadota bacterium]|nr:TRAP transporter large permease subunit [Pseudomonadota bacterium]